MSQRSTVDVSAARPVDAVPARHRPRTVRVERVVTETADAVTLVLDVAPEDVDAFGYRAGQFVTLRVEVDGEVHLRSYSMSSSPDVDAELRITIKRVPGGVVSNWVHDHVRAGHHLKVLPPAGAFVLDPSDDEVVAFAAGSGITPVLSIVKAVLDRTDRRVALCYANRDRASTIFADELDALAARHADRFVLRHHHDVERGFVTAAEVEGFVAGGVDRVDRVDRQFYVCGPTPFMEVVESTLVTAGVDGRRIHVERFTPADDEPVDGPVDGNDGDEGAADGGVAPVVTLRMGRQRAEAVHRPGTTILQTARAVGLRAPSSCETGSCATCMARVTEGRVEMRNNEALTADEVDEGWVLTCQAVPVTPTVTVIYE